MSFVLPMRATASACFGRMLRNVLVDLLEMLAELLDYPLCLVVLETGWGKIQLGLVDSAVLWHRVHLKIILVWETINLTVWSLCNRLGLLWAGAETSKRELRGRIWADFFMFERLIFFLELLDHIHHLLDFFILALQFFATDVVLHCVWGNGIPCSIDDVWHDCLKTVLHPHLVVLVLRRLDVDCAPVDEGSRCRFQLVVHQAAYNLLLWVCSLRQSLERLGLVHVWTLAGLSIWLAKNRNIVVIILVGIFLFWIRIWNSWLVHSQWSFEFRFDRLQLGKFVSLL